MTDENTANREAVRLGSLLGVIAAHGMPAVQDAIAALQRGKATPRQQLIGFQVIRSAAPGMNAFAKQHGEDGNA